MKKNLIKTMVAAVCVVAACMGGVKAYNVTYQSETNMLLAENVEALASGDPGGKTCYNTITTKDGCMVLYCQTCAYVPGTNAWNSGTGSC